MSGSAGPSRAIAADPRSRYFVRHAWLGGRASASPARNSSNASRACASLAAPDRTRYASSQAAER